MAKKKTDTPAPVEPAPKTRKRAVKLNEKDARTLEALNRLAQSVINAANGVGDPEMYIPSRSLSNVWFDEKKRIIQMGDRTTTRQLFNLSQAKAFMQTMLVASGTSELIRQGKTTSIRGLYYLMKHTIEHAKEETFNDQSESDPIIEDCEVLLECLREEMHLYAQTRGAMVGMIQIVDKGDTIDCSRMGSGGYAVPSIVEPDVIQFKNCKADFILHVEKDTVWQRFNEDKFWKKHNCILTHGSGQPPRGMRRLLYRMNRELNLPVICLLDNDPWGYYIYSVIKQGSINLAFESKRMAIPSARFLGLRSKDFEACGLSKSARINLNDTDRKRARQIAEYPWFKNNKPWQQEIRLMLENGFKLEVESLISKDISYVTEIYTPQRLAAQDWLD